MKLLDFTKKFKTEDDCKQYLKSHREKQGLVCPRCGCIHFKWKKCRESWECKECGKRISLTSGTVMHNTKLPLMYWFIAIHLLTSMRKSISAAELQRQLGHNRYQPIWEMLHKLRDVMGQRDAEYKLAGCIELDEGFFTTEIETGEKDVPLKRGRGSQRKTKVLVMAESQPNEVENKKKKIQKRVGYIKMIVIPDLKAKTIDKEVVRYINENAELTTDDSSSYINFKNLVKSHMSQVIEPKNISKVLPWVHIAISNAKRQILDIHHAVSSELLQGYLNEFCFKHNRRYMDVFDRLMYAGLQRRTAFMHRTYVA